MQLRSLGSTDIRVSPVALGCWPIAGMTSLHVNDGDSLATLRTCLDVGVNFLDTAYCYGTHGESERLIARALRDCRDSLVIATKGGVHWDSDGQRVTDGRPETIKRECDESLRRLQTDWIDLYYLHAPDPQVPVAESATAFHDLLAAGKVRAVGVSNFSVTQLEQFYPVCEISAVQPPYNMLQREIEDDLLPWCQARSIAAVIYWPLMKGLLAGKLKRDHRFEEGDGRAKYPMFQGEEWQRNQDFLDRLRDVARQCGKTVAQVVINWTIHRPGISVALCGAKRASQLRENAGAMGWELSQDQLLAIEQAIDERGPPVTRSAI